MQQPVAPQQQVQQSICRHNLMQMGRWSCGLFMRVCSHLSKYLHPTALDLQPPAKVVVRSQQLLDVIHV